MILNKIEKYLFTNYNKYESEIYIKSKENPSKLNEKIETIKLYALIDF